MIYEQVCHLKKPIGLNNLGNTCYLNCCLQILLSSKIMSAEIENLRLVDYSKTIFLQELLFLKTSGNTKSLYNLLINKYPDYNTNEQQDTNECFLRILDILENELRVTNKLIPLSPKLDPSIKPDKLLKQFSLFSWKMHNLTLPSICKIFYGQIRELITCRTCKQEKNNFIPFNSLSLVNCNNISEGLKNFQQTEYIKDFDCNTCMRKTEIRKCQIIWKLPKVLILQFPTKGLDSIKDNLNIEDYMKVKNYKLISIGCHNGISINSGHYYTFVKKGNKWYLANDSEIQSVSMDNILRHIQHIYIVCYERI